MPTRRQEPRVLELAPRRADTAVVAHLEGLLAEAKAGRITGAIAAVHYGGREYGYLGSGSLCEDPRLGLHAVAALAKKMLR